MKLKYFICGLIAGIFISGVAWAASSFVWVDDSGAAMGTTSNPVYITTQ